MRRYLPYLLLTISLTPVAPSFAQSPAPPPANIPVIDDLAFVRNFPSKLGDLLEKEAVPEGKTLQEQWRGAEGKTLSLTPVTKQTTSSNHYATTVDSVGVIASIYHCGKCDKWHRGSAATCWVANAEGILVTNAHVFDEAAKQRAFGVIFRDGTVRPVTAILAVDRTADIAVFQINPGDGPLSPLPLGTDAAVGANVHVISHPDGKFFTYTHGHVSRYFLMRRQIGEKNPPVFMGITADYAKGSSGGPLLDDSGAVVGMVSSTSSIYYGNPQDKEKRGDLQMTLHNCVPGFALRQILHGTTTPQNATH